MVIHGYKNIYVKAKVLKHIPKEALKCHQEATDIAIQ